MSYTEFSTDKADYILHLNTHFFERGRGIKFSSLDALIIETWCDHDTDILRMDKVEKMFNMELIEKIKEENVPIFHVDPKSSISATGDLRTLIGEFPIFPIILAIGLYKGLTNGRTNNVSDRVYADINYFLQLPDGEGKNAIIAEKIEKGVVPLLKKEKPRIGIIYGAEHIGLKYDLMSERRRNFTLRNFREFNFSRFSGFLKDQLNIIYEARYDKETGLWNTKKHKLDLF